MNSLRLDNFKKLFPMQKNFHDMETRQHERYHVVRIMASDMQCLQFQVCKSY